MTITALESSIDVAEGEEVNFCVEINGIAPFGGLEVDVIVGIEGEVNGNLTGLIFRFIHIIQTVVIPSSYRTSNIRSKNNGPVVNAMEVLYLSRNTP